MYYTCRIQIGVLYWQHYHFSFFNIWCPGETSQNIKQPIWKFPWSINISKSIVQKTTVIRNKNKKFPVVRDQYLNLINPLTAFHCFRYFVLMTNSIFMCPNAVLLSEHYYDICHRYLYFVIAHCATVSDSVQCTYWTNQSMSYNALFTIFSVWCNDNTHQRCLCYSRPIFLNIPEKILIQVLSSEA